MGVGPIVIGRVEAIGNVSWWVGRTWDEGADKIGGVVGQKGILAHVLQQIEVVEIFERVSADAGDAVGIEQKKLQRRKTVKHPSRKFGDPIPVQNPIQQKDRQVDMNEI